VTPLPDSTGVSAADQPAVGSADLPPDSAGVNAADQPAVGSADLPPDSPKEI